MEKILRHLIFFYLSVFTTVVIFPSEAASASDASNGSDDIVRTRIICTELQTVLARTGFENVLVLYDSVGSIIINYENRLFRNEMTALGKVLTCSFQYLNEINNVVLIIKQFDLPVVALQAKSADLQEFMLGKMTKRDFRKHIHFLASNYAYGDFEMSTGLPLSNSSFRRVDLILRPIVDSNLGNREDPFKFKLDLQLGVSTPLSRGLTIQVSSRIQILDELNTSNKESVRLYSAILNYLTPLSLNTFLSTNIGYFSGERYGISSQVVRYFLSRNVALSARVDYTGFLFYDDYKWFYSGLNLWTYNFGAYWQFSSYGFRASVQFGKYLLGEHGVRIALGRYMRESRLDFFGIVTSEGNWGGVELRIPLFPNKRFRPRTVRLNIPDLYLVKYDYLATERGKTFTIANDLNEFRSDLTENYILNHLEELLLFFRSELPAITVSKKFE